MPEVKSEVEETETPDFSREAGWQDQIDDVEGFWNEETQSLICGIVVSTTVMTLANRETPVAILKLTAPCKAVKGKKKEQETIELQKGDAIGVVIKHKLQNLYRCVENQVEVAIKAKEKVDLDGGNTMWRYAMKTRGVLSRFAPPSSPTADRAGRKNPESEADKAFAEF